MVMASSIWFTIKEQCGSASLTRFLLTSTELGSFFSVFYLMELNLHRLQPSFT